LPLLHPAGRLLRRHHQPAYATNFGVKVQEVPLLPSKAPFSKRFEDAVGQACESASARQVARRLGLAESTVRAIDLRYRERWATSRRQPARRQMGVDEIHLGTKQKFLTVVCNLETAEPVWFGRERKKKTLDEFFQEDPSARQRRGIESACVDMWEPYRLSMEQWAPNCRIVYDQFHIMQHAHEAIDEVRRGRVFSKRLAAAGSGERETLAAAEPVGEPDRSKRQELNQLFALNRNVFKAYLLEESWTGCGRIGMKGRCGTTCSVGSTSFVVNAWSGSRNWRRCCWTTSTEF
jgi:transposase